MDLSDSAPFARVGCLVPTSFLFVSNPGFGLISNLGAVLANGFGELGDCDELADVAGEAAGVGLAARSLRWDTWQSVVFAFWSGACHETDLGLPVAAPAVAYFTCKQSTFKPNHIYDRFELQLMRAALTLLIAFALLSVGDRLPAVLAS